MTFSHFLSTEPVRFDGGLGTLLQARGLPPGEAPERWCLTRPDVLTDIHRQYFDAGSNVATTDTFGANRLHFSAEELKEIIPAAVRCARLAAAQSEAPQEKFVALDVGPSGRMLRPLGDLDFEDAVRLFAETVRLGAQAGADLILIETMNDSYETKAALLAAKENCSLPVIVSNAYGADGKLMTGATPQAMAALLEGMGADAIGANCSLGPEQLRGVVTALLESTSLPVLFQPNAGLPRVVDGKTCYDVGEAEFAASVASLVKQGVRLFGGCCGTTPAYIAALTAATRDLRPRPTPLPKRTVVSSYTHAVCLSDDPVLIGERINPTGKKRFQQALRAGDTDYILSEGLRQQAHGVHLLDVNVGLPDVDEVKLLADTVCELQAVCDLPLQIDTADPVAMEAALRRYNGKAMLNSVNGKRESMEAVFPLARKYGGVIVALTLDESGIPPTAEGRVAVARKIIETAASYGIGKENLVFDTLAMTVSAEPNAARVTLEALRRIRTELGCHTSLGISNVSFGLPRRDAVNSTFFALALANGLSAAIINPDSAEMRKTYFAYRALRGLDENCAAYIAAAEEPEEVAKPAEKTARAAGRIPPSASELQTAILQGRRERARELADALLSAGTDPLALIDRDVIPALNTVGEGFEKKTVYLPQLLMSAEAAKSAFEAVKATLAGQAQPAGKGPFVLATVQGDIHDIGKNIVRLLLENYGFRVVDLGKDVPPERVVETVVELHAPLAGLSALMTTTVPAMEATIRLLRERAPWCRTVVGGAVLTQEYADQIGADCYSKDAMETVRYAEAVLQTR